MKRHMKAQVNGCLCKNRYSTKELAEAARLWCERERGMVLRVYECEFCLGFHLTKKPTNQQNTTTLQPRLQVVTFNERGQVTSRQEWRVE